MEESVGCSSWSSEELIYCCQSLIDSPIPSLKDKRTTIIRTSVSSCVCQNQFPNVVSFSELLVEKACLEAFRCLSPDSKNISNPSTNNISPYRKILNKSTIEKIVENPSIKPYLGLINTDCQTDVTTINDDCNLYVSPPSYVCDLCLNSEFNCGFHQSYSSSCSSSTNSSADKLFSDCKNNYKEESLTGSRLRDEPWLCDTASVRGDSLPAGDLVNFGNDSCDHLKAIISESFTIAEIPSSAYIASSASQQNERRLQSTIRCAKIHNFSLSSSPIERTQKDLDFLIDLNDKQKFPSKVKGKRVARMPLSPLHGNLRGVPIGSEGKFRSVPSASLAIAEQSFLKQSEDVTVPVNKTPECFLLKNDFFNKAEVSHCEISFKSNLKKGFLDISGDVVVPIKEQLSNNLVSFNVENDITNSNKSHVSVVTPPTSIFIMPGGKGKRSVRRKKGTYFQNGQRNVKSNNSEVNDKNESCILEKDAIDASKNVTPLFENNIELKERELFAIHVHNRNSDQSANENYFNESSFDPSDHLPPVISPVISLGSSNASCDPLNKRYSNLYHASPASVSDVDGDNDFAASSGDSSGSFINKGCSDFETSESSNLGVSSPVTNAGCYSNDNIQSNLELKQCQKYSEVGTLSGRVARDDSYIEEKINSDENFYKYLVGHVCFLVDRKTCELPLYSMKEVLCSQIIHDSLSWKLATSGKNWSIGTLDKENNLYIYYTKEMSDYAIFENKKNFEKESKSDFFSKLDGFAVVSSKNCYVKNLIPVFSSKMCNDTINKVTSEWKNLDCGQDITSCVKLRPKKINKNEISYSINRKSAACDMKMYRTYDSFYPSEETESFIKDSRGNRSIKLCGVFLHPSVNYENQKIFNAKRHSFDSVDISSIGPLISSNAFINCDDKNLSVFTSNALIAENKGFKVASSEASIPVIEDTNISEKIPREPTKFEVPLEDSLFIDKFDESKSVTDIKSENMCQFPNGQLLDVCEMTSVAASIPQMPQVSSEVSFPIPSETGDNFCSELNFKDNDFVASSLGQNISRSLPTSDVNVVSTLPSPSYLTSMCSVTQATSSIGKMSVLPILPSFEDKWPTISSSLLKRNSFSNASREAKSLSREPSSIQSKVSDFERLNRDLKSKHNPLNRSTTDSNLLKKTSQNKKKEMNIGAFDTAQSSKLYQTKFPLDIICQGRLKEKKLKVPLPEKELGGVEKQRSPAEESQLQKKCYPTVRSKSICDNIMLRKFHAKKSGDVTANVKSEGNSEDAIRNPPKLENPSLPSQKKKIKLDDSLDYPDSTITMVPSIQVTKISEINFNPRPTEYSLISAEPASTDNLLSSVAHTIVTSSSPEVSSVSVISSSPVIYSEMSFTLPEILSSSTHSFQKENSPISLVSTVLQSASKTAGDSFVERSNVAISLSVNSPSNQRILEDINQELVQYPNHLNDSKEAGDHDSNIGPLTDSPQLSEADVPSYIFPVQSLSLQVETSAAYNSASSTAVHSVEADIPLPDFSSTSKSEVEDKIPDPFFLSPFENSLESTDPLLTSMNPKGSSSVAMVKNCKTRGRERKEKSCDEGKRGNENFNVRAVSTGSKSFVYRVTSYKEFGDANSVDSVQVDGRISNEETKPIFTSYKELHPVVDDSVQLIGYKDNGSVNSYTEFDHCFNKVTKYLEINPFMPVAEEDVKLISYKEFMPDFDCEHSLNWDSQLRPYVPLEHEENVDNNLDQCFSSENDWQTYCVDSHAKRWPVQKTNPKTEMELNYECEKKSTLQPYPVPAHINYKGEKTITDNECVQSHSCPLICESCSKIDQFADEFVSSILNIDHLFPLIDEKNKEIKNKQNGARNNPQTMATETVVCSVSMPERPTPVSFVVEEVFDFVDDSSSDEYEDPETTLDESFKSLDIETLEIPSLTTPDSFNNSTGSIVTVVDNITPTPSPLPIPPSDLMAPSPTYSLQRPNFLTNVTFLSRTPSPKTILVSPSRSSDNNNEDRNPSPDEDYGRNYSMFSSLEIPVRPLGCSDEGDKTPTPSLNYVEVLHYNQSLETQPQGEENKEFLSVTDGRTPLNTFGNKVSVTYSYKSEEEAHSASSFDGTSEDKDLLASISASSTGSVFSWSPSQGPVARRDLLPLEDDDEPRPSWQALLAVNRPDSDDERNGYESDDDFESMDVEMRRLEEKLKKFELELGLASGGNLSFEKSKTDIKAFSRPRLRPEDVDILKTFSLPQVYPPVNITKTKHLSLMDKMAMELYEGCEDNSVRSSFRGSSMESGSTIFVKPKKKLKKGDRCCRSLDLQKISLNKKGTKISNSKINLTNKMEVSGVQEETYSQCSYDQVQEVIDNTMKTMESIPAIEYLDVNVSLSDNLGGTILPTLEQLSQTVSTKFPPLEEVSVPLYHSIGQDSHSGQSPEHPKELYEYSEQLYIGYLWHEESSGMTALDFEGLDDLTAKDVENSLMFIFEDDDIEDNHDYFSCTAGNIGDSDLSLYHSTDSKIKSIDQQSYDAYKKKPDSLVSAFKNSFKKAAKYLGPINFSKNIKEESKESDDDLALNFELKTNAKGSETGKYHVPTARIRNDGKSDSDHGAGSSMYSSGEYYASPAICVITSSSEDEQHSFEASDKSFIEQHTQSPSVINKAQVKNDDKISVRSEYSCWYDSLSDQRKVSEIIESPDKDTVFCLTGFSNSDDDRPVQISSRRHSPSNHGFGGLRNDDTQTYITEAIEEEAERTN